MRLPTKYFSGGRAHMPTLLVISTIAYTLI